ncbi:MAG TPA: GNAT family N-acetyltransferase [Cyclobacteriaceae bacterium]|jgi:RimJ/RimL family protein N-acetyltransferase|nr:GNAT family N-acetyltransferase [Cyclobacteriaceae bacterium]
MKTHLTRDQRPFAIRRASETDAERIINYSKILFASTDQVLTTLQEYTISVADEKKWINNFNASPNALLLVAELENQMVGLLFFAASAKLKSAHTGEFGVSVHPKYQRTGIGRALIESLLDWAKDHPQIEKIFLQVFATNSNAIKLYQRMGFVEEGRHVKAIKQPSSEYVDIIQMYIEMN